MKFLTCICLRPSPSIVQYQRVQKTRVGLNRLMGHIIIPRSTGRIAQNRPCHINVFPQVGGGGGSLFCSLRRLAPPKLH